MRLLAPYMQDGQPGGAAGGCAVVKAAAPCRQQVCAPSRAGHRAVQACTPLGACIFTCSSPHMPHPCAVCERVGTPGEALLEAFKPQPYTELVGGKTMAQVGGAARGAAGSGGVPHTSQHAGGCACTWQMAAGAPMFCCFVAQCMPPLPPSSQAGCIPILHMRGFQKGGQLPADLVADIQSRHSA